MGSIMTSCERECMIAAVDKAASEYQREINFFRSAAHREVLVPPHSPALCKPAARRPGSCSSICSAGMAPLMGLMMYRRTACCCGGNQMLLHHFTEIRRRRVKKNELEQAPDDNELKTLISLNSFFVPACETLGFPVLPLSQTRKPKKAEKKSYKSSEPSQVGQLAKRANESVKTVNF